MGNIKRKHPTAFKARVAIELIKEAETIAQVCSKYSIHPSQATAWKKQALDGLGVIFTDKPKDELKEKEELVEELYKQIGQLKVELDWLKKKFR